MAEIVNLRQARKAKTRADRAAGAEASRLAHGRSKVERASTAAAIDKAERFVDAHRREGPDETDPAR